MNELSMKLALNLRSAVVVVLLAVTTTACQLAGDQAKMNPQPQSSAEASQRGGLADAVDSLVVTEALNRGVPGLAVVVIADGVVLVKRGYGIADVESGRQVTESTPFNIASLTKVFTAAIVQM